MKGPKPIKPIILQSDQTGRGSRVVHGFGFRKKTKAGKPLKITVNKNGRKFK